MSLFHHSFYLQRSWDLVVARTLEVPQVLLVQHMFQWPSSISIMKPLLGGGFKQFLLFSPLPWEMIQFDSYCSSGLKPPGSLLFEVVLHIPVDNI